VVSNLSNEYAKQMDVGIRQAIELIGCSLNADVPIHYPQLRGLLLESELFRWFQENEKSDNAPRQSLKPITQATQSLPPLTRHPQPPPNERRRR